jgi:hypothetical protein
VTPSDRQENNLQTLKQRVTNPQLRVIEDSTLIHIHPNFTSFVLNGIRYRITSIYDSRNVEAVEIHPPTAVGHTLPPNISAQMVRAVIMQSI